MSKTFKRALSVLMAVAMLLAFCVTASAVDDDANTAAIQVNGTIIDYPSGVAPYYDDEIGRVYVPFRDLLTALGAVVSYDEEQSAAIAVRGDVTVSYVLGADEYTIATADETRDVTFAVKPIEIDGRVLVPVRFISETIGANVGWDETELTVLIVDPYLINAANTATYEIISKLDGIAAEAGDLSATHAVLDASLTIEDETAGAVEIPLTATVDLVSSKTAIDAKLNIKSDLTSIFGAEIPGFSAAIDLDADLIYNTETGIFALQSDGLYALAATLLGASSIEAGTWLTLDTAELLAEFGATAATVDAPEITDIADVVDYLTVTLVQSVTLTSVDDYAILATAFDAINAIYADENFVKTGDAYVSTLTLDDDGAKFDFTLTITTDADDKATGVAFDLELTEGTLGKLTFHVDTDGTTVALTFTLTSDGIAASLTLDLTTEATETAPRAEIPEGAAAVDFETVFGELA
ncbi:MAG: copper amine oxidase N-terminal domain-containing protein [Oscillospiraceae bacterium]|jgi:hypothetical protein|nr:copper amine oxidase N-terminal domain-containing protein [Oscillospiraceae bacterium]